jgi:glucosamine-6-phosphate deaminase
MAALEVPKDFLVRERLLVTVYKSPEDASKVVAREIADLIKSKGGRCVLGLATGSTPTGVYDELVRLHKEEGLSFRGVVTFNLDEYYPMEPTQIQSYVRFMKENLFDQIDILPENINIPDGTVPFNQVDAHCQEYEERIKLAGGIDLQILGIGRSGHIGFNEPGSLKTTRTRIVDLDRSTRIDAASDFFGVEHVPHQAITMGISSILASKRIIMLAFSEGKARNVCKTAEGEVTASLPASFLQLHSNSALIVDEAAACELTRIKTPWILAGATSNIKYTPLLARKAVIWLSLTLAKPILKLVEEDYHDNHLSALLATYGPAPTLNLRVFRHLQNTITGWPGGRPTTAATPASPVLSASASIPATDPWLQAVPNLHPPSKRIIVFSPHPDDDVISMGGTLIRLCEQGHVVHVAYQTSGNIAVWDEDALRFANFATQFAAAFGVDGAALKKISGIEDSAEKFIASKLPAEVDSKEIQKIKGLIRQTEARAAARNAGVRPDRIHFLELPFYETGAVKKKPLGEEDIEIVKKFLETVKPDQIYAAGDLSDPHGTHRVCLKAVLHAIDRLKNEQWMKECAVWLYRGAWQEWEPERIEMAVPMSPHEMVAKRLAIFKHQSQKDVPFFPGNDKREFWVRAEDRNRATAQLYDKLGLQEFEGLEAFVRWHIGNPFGSNPVDLK